MTGVLVFLALAVPTSVAAASAPHTGPLGVQQPALAPRPQRRPCLDETNGGAL